jgi:hypothetical protein
VERTIQHFAYNAARWRRASVRRPGAQSRANLAVRRRVRLDGPASSIVARDSAPPSERIYSARRNRGVLRPAEDMLRRMQQLRGNRAVQRFLQRENSRFAPRRVHAFPAIQRLKDEALRNADSYALFVLNVSGATVAETAPRDTPTVLNGPEFTAVRHTLALLQARLVKTRGQLLFLYEDIHTSKPPAKAWTNAEAEALMRVVAPLFGLTVPPLLPTMRDQVGVAGMRERCSHLASIVFTAIDLRKVPATTTTWSTGPGQQVNLGDDFFKLGLTVGDSHINLLLAKMAEATPEIPRAHEPQYVTMAQQIGKP